MAFCGNCGAQINDGVQFCPKCGQPTSNTSTKQESVNYNSFNNQPEDEDMKTWQKIVSVLLWPVGAIILIIALVKKQTAKAKSAFTYTAVGIGLVIALNVSLDGCSSDDFDTTEDEMVDSEVSDVEEAGYNDGYEFGFQFGSEYIDEGAASVAYSARFDAPSTPEEKRLYKLYEEAYKKGFQEGRKAKN